MPSRHETIRSAAFNILINTKAPETVDILIAAASPGKTQILIELRQKAVESMGQLEKGDSRTRGALAKALQDENPRIVLTAALAFGSRKDASALAELRLIQSNPPADEPELAKKRY